jgi:hypothetical protein
VLRIGNAQQENKEKGSSGVDVDKTSSSQWTNQVLPAIGMEPLKGK